MAVGSERDGGVSQSLSEPPGRYSLSHGDVVVARPDREAVLAAIDRAEAIGRHTNVFFPPGVYDLGGGLSLRGKTCVIRGAGAYGDGGTVFTASAQRGPVLDFSGWISPMTADSRMGMRDRAFIGDFRVTGSGRPDKTRNNVGIRFTALHSVSVGRISISDTGGACVQGLYSKEGAAYLCDFSEVICSEPVECLENNIPWFHFVTPNGTRFDRIGFRAGPDRPCPPSGVMRIEGHARGNAYMVQIDQPWFENLAPVTDGTLIHISAVQSRVRDMGIHDCSKRTGAQRTTACRIAPTATDAIGGVEVTGFIPGANAFDYGVDIQQSQCVVEGVKGWRGANVRLAPGVENCSINLRGAHADATGPAVVDDSQRTTNVITDARTAQWSGPRQGYRRVRPDRYYGSGAHVPSSLTVEPRMVYYVPLFLPSSMRVGELALRVLSGADASVATLGLYSASQASDEPSSLVFAADPITCDTPGVKGARCNGWVQAGLYFLAVSFDGGTPTVVSLGNSDIPPISATGFADSVNCLLQRVDSTNITLGHRTRELPQRAQIDGVGTNGPKILAKAI